MFTSFEWMVAARYLRARRAEGFISVIAGFSFLGIMLGVATLIIVLSVMNGVRADLLNRILGLNGHIIIQSVSGPLEGYEDMTRRIRGVEGVTSARPIIDGQVMAITREFASGAVVRGVRPSDLRAKGVVADGIVAGSLENLDSRNDIVVGSRLAQRLGVRIGDALTLISPQGTTTPFGTVPRSRAYRVAAVFEVGMFQFDSTFIFMPLEAAQLYFDTGSGVGALEIWVEDPDDMAGARARIGAVLGPVLMTDWQQTNSQLVGALTVQRNVMALIVALIILVAAFNIVSSLIMLVKDKGHDIAVLRTMGATRGMILRVFFLAGASVGVFGTLAGLGLGLLLAANADSIRLWLEGLTGTKFLSAEINFLTQLPTRIEPSEVVLVVLMGIGLSFLATIYPSWRAARLDPVEALRYE
ncbi:MAG: lipoprotein-releasing ABC transporter permease subunit [Proteobacteria bacterium]|nr:lipoprotein-releasing ABC transporter permease subunit [Pseudomonadota bacterium]